METIINFNSFGKFDDEQLFNFCYDNKELRIERDSKGQIIIMAPTGLETSFFNSDLAYEIIKWNKKYKKGKVSVSNGGYTLQNGAMRSPDVGFVSNERLKKISDDERKKFSKVCPDFIIELISESDSINYTKEKMEEWMENGCRLGWLIDSKNQKTYIYRENGERIIQTFEHELSGENVLEGLSIKLSELI